MKKPPNPGTLCQVVKDYPLWYQTKIRMLRLVPGQFVMFLGHDANCRRLFLAGEHILFDRSETCTQTVFNYYLKVLT